MAASGLINHGWSYINIDDAWQGERGGEFHAIQGNEKFPDMKGLCDTIHGMGLKIGIYSTPWVTSYATHIGGSAGKSRGPLGKTRPFPRAATSIRKFFPGPLARYHFATNDARQWAAWGFDYLKYDWNPNEAARDPGDGRRPPPERTRHRLQPLQQLPFHQRARPLQRSPIAGAPPATSATTGIP